MDEAKGMAGWTAFVLIVVGTLGLLVNEFMLDWGRVATLAFAGLNAVGLVIVGFSLTRSRQRRDP